MNGEVIGINSAKLASTEVEGMGYAIPISRVSDIIENLMNEQTRTKVAAEDQGTIGIKCLDVSSQIQQAYNCLLYTSRPLPDQPPARCFHSMRGKPLCYSLPHRRWDTVSAALEG